MIKAAFCDDDISALKEMQGYLDRYRRERDRESSLILRCGGVITRMELEQLEFCEIH